MQGTSERKQQHTKPNNNICSFGFFRFNKYQTLFLMRKCDKPNTSISCTVSVTPLSFAGDAICLSGLTGTKLKCDVLRKYYPFWWGITSGGPSRNHGFQTAIVELNAATGEVCIEDTKETVLGSAGHALELKVNSSQTENLKVVLVEEDDECYDHLKKVIVRRWPTVSIEEAEGDINANQSGIYLLKMALDNALEAIAGIELGNTLYFFDPLRRVEYAAIEKVASSRLKKFYKTGTEFIIFVFTSDWFLGRDDFAPLPSNTDEKAWTIEEKMTVSEADALFGNREWRPSILTQNAVLEKERLLIEVYRRLLHRWFRYVLPLPFNPKEDQIFHIILCSNYEAGVRATRNFYSAKTGNPKYAPDNNASFRRFQRLHPEIFRDIGGRRRPLQWLLLWKIITQHEEGICDSFCPDFKENEPNPIKRQLLLDWLEEKGYLNPFNVQNAWNLPVKQYMLNWRVVKEKLGVDSPTPLRPLSSEDMSK
jgi:three-Cys-motif partner protein